MLQTADGLNELKDYRIQRPLLIILASSQQPVTSGQWTCGLYVHTNCLIWGKNMPDLSHSTSYTWQTVISLSGTKANRDGDKEGYSLGVGCVFEQLMAECVVLTLAVDPTLLSLRSAGRLCRLTEDSLPLLLARSRRVFLCSL